MTGERKRAYDHIYMAAYSRAMRRLARAHPAEFTRILDDERNAPARRAVLEEAAAPKRRRTA